MINKAFKRGFFVLLLMLALCPMSHAATAALKVSDMISKGPVVDVRAFGAFPDDGINDTEELAAVAAHINAAGRGTIRFAPGHYDVGKQTLSGALGLDGSWVGVDILHIHDCTGPVIIEGNGATLRIVDGLKFGSFDPVTGAAYPGLTADNDYQSSIAFGVVRLANNKSVHVSDLEIDGNLQNLIVGGQYGDTGYQIGAHGIALYSNGQALIENVYSHHNGTDGIYASWIGAAEGDDAAPVTLINVVSEYNGRQGLSWVGGVGFTAINSKFNHTGKAVNIGTGDALVSAPGAGLDIEASGAGCRSGHFSNCEFIDNAGYSFVGASGDSADVVFDSGCKFVATTSSALWPQIPGVVFKDCKIYGAIANIYYSDDPAESTKFLDCLITDADYGDYEVYQAATLGSLIFVSTPTDAWWMERCTINATKSRPGRLDYVHISDSTINMTFAGTDVAADQSYSVYFPDAHLKNNRIDSNITENIPATGYYIYIVGAVPEGTNTLTNTSGNMRWINPTSGHVGVLGEMPRHVISYHFPSITAGSSDVSDHAVTGARIGAAVSVTLARGYSGLTLQGYVSNNDQVTVIAHNHTGAAIDPVSGILRIFVNNLVN